MIYTGTCSGVGAASNPPRFLKAGDTVRVEIASLGAIVARCVEEVAGEATGGGAGEGATA